MEKQITLTLKQAKELYGKNPEMDKLLLANFTIDELTKKFLPKTWEELGKISGFYLSDGKIKESELLTANQYFKHRFYSQKEAKAALAMAQLSQLMIVYNDGWVPDWKTNDPKYCIFRDSSCKLNTDYFYSSYHYVAFKSSEIRSEFILNFSDLLRDYFMMD